MGTPAVFTEEKTHPKLFQRRVDTSDVWEVSFYRSLADSDGTVLIGGGYSTFNAGQIAIGARIPILALEKSGGAASSVWKTLSPSVDLPSSDEHARMAHAVSEDAVKDWVDALDAQRRRRYAVETAPIKRHAVIAISLFAVSLALALASHLIEYFARGATGTCLLLGSTLLGGGSGAAIRMVFERRYGRRPSGTSVNHCNPSAWDDGRWSSWTSLSRRATRRDQSGSTQCYTICVDYDRDQRHWRSHGRVCVS